VTGNQHRGRARKKTLTTNSSEGFSKKKPLNTKSYEGVSEPKTRDQNARSTVGQIAEAAVFKEAQQQSGAGDRNYSSIARPMAARSTVRWRPET
jgi:hypothetical protein